MKKFLILFMLTATTGFAQSIANYKYAIIPAKFSAQKKEGQFGLNELTRQFLQKNGYTAYLDSEILPLEVIKDNCNKIYVNVLEDNSIRKTKLWVEIKDCANKVLFRSAVGESLDKDNRVAYNQALRSAFKSFDKPEFRYDPSTIGQPARETQSVEVMVPTRTPAVEQKPDRVTETILSAQPISNGYQLVDTTPKIVMKIFTTSNPDVFIGESENGNGVVLKKDGRWFFEFYQQGTLVVRPLNIRF